MPAQSGEPFRGHTSIIMRNAQNNVAAAWSVSVTDVDPALEGADRTDWDYAPGDTVTLRLEFVNPGNIQLATLTEVTLRIPGTGTILGTWNAPNSLGLHTQVLRFDNAPFDGVAGAVRAGTLEVYLRVQSTGGTDAWGPWDSRGDQTDPPLLIIPANSSWGRGYLRARSKLSAFSVSNVALGGAQPATFVYTDPTHNRVGVDAPFYRTADSFVVSHLSGATVIRTGGVAIASAATDMDVSFIATSGNSARVHNAGGTTLGGAYPVGSVAVRAVLPSRDFGGDNEYAWATSGHLAGWNVIDTMTLEVPARFTSDPRLTFTQHLQESVNTFATPPSSLREVSNEMLSTVLGFVAARVQNARGTGINLTGGSGVGISYSFRDLNNLVAASTVTDQSTGPGGGEDGWGPLMAWAASKPGGTWRNVVTFRDAAGQQGTTNHDYTMLAADPRIAPAVGGGSAGNQDDHFSPGDNLVVALSLFFGKTKAKVVADSGSAECAITRLNLATGTAQHLDSDGVWKDMGTGSAYFWPLLMSPTDSGVARRVFGQGAVHTVIDTSAWETYDIILIAQARYGGTPYTRMGIVSVTGGKNRHSRYEFDLVGYR